MAGKKERAMTHYDRSVHCKKCGEYLGTYNAISDNKDELPDELKNGICDDKEECKLRKQGKLKKRNW